MAKKRPRGITKPARVDMDDVDREGPDLEFIKQRHGGRMPTREEMLAGLRKSKEGQDVRSARAIRAARTRARNKAAVDPDKVRLGVTVHPEDQVYLKWLGKNNVSKGIRIACEIAREQYKPAPDLDRDGTRARISELRGELKKRKKDLPR